MIIASCLALYLAYFCFLVPNKGNSYIELLNKLRGSYYEFSKLEDRIPYNYIIIKAGNEKAVCV